MYDIYQRETANLILPQAFDSYMPYCALNGLARPNSSTLEQIALA